MPQQPAKLREADVTAQVKLFMEHRGWRLVRNQRTVVPGQFQAGEPGIPDYLALRYLENGVVLAIWIELKRPGARGDCRCAARTRGLCTTCAQREWRVREQRRGAVVVRVDDIASFDRWYQTGYAWLHGSDGVGQLRLSEVEGEPTQAS